MVIFFSAYSTFTISKFSAPTGFNGKMCPGFCPIDCPEGQQPCQPDFDANGCPMPQTCGCGDDSCPRTNDWRGCPVTPRPTCNEGEMVCANGADDRGCHTGFSCHPGFPNKCPAPALPPPNFYTGPIPDPTLTATNAPSTAAPVPTGAPCDDKWASKKCQNRKKRGQCKRGWVKKNCQSTCEFC